MYNYVVLVHELSSALAANGSKVRTTVLRKDLRFTVDAEHHTAALRLSSKRFMSAHSASYRVVSRSLMESLPAGVRADHAILMTIEQAHLKAERQQAVATALALHTAGAALPTAEREKKVKAPYSQAMRAMRAQQDERSKLMSLTSRSDRR